MQKYTLSPQGKAGLISSLVFIFIISYWYFAFDGFDFYDDYSYSFFANQIAEGTFKAGDNHFTHRVGVFVPVALFYKIFGVGDYSTILWPLICHLASVALVFFTLRKNDLEAAVAATILSALCFYPLFFCKELYPDPIVSCFGMASAFILFKYRNKNSTSSYFFSFLFICFVFQAFLSKETILYFFPFYLFVFIHDILKKINFKFWIGTFFIGLIFISFYFLWYEIKMGSYLYRFHAIQEGHYEFEGSYYQKSFWEIIPRLTYQPFLTLISTEMIIPFIIALPSVFSIKLKELKDLEKEESFWTLLVISILLMFWFSSTSFKFYNPIFLQGRMILMLIPPLAIISGMGWKKIRESVYWNKLIIILFFVLTVFQAFYDSPKNAIVYLNMTLFLLMVFFIRKFKFQYLLLVILFLVMAFHPMYSMVKPTTTGYQSEKQIIREFLTKGEGRNIVIVDPQLYSGHLYYYGFHENPHYEYIKFNTISKEKPLAADHYYILINPYSWDLFNQLGVASPAWVKNPSKDWKLIAQKEKVRLYQAIDAESILKYY